MSIALIRAALESALSGMTPPLATAWENAPYTPVAGTPYQAVFLLMARPGKMDMGQQMRREQGMFKVVLRYPLNAGPAAAQARAELIRSTFYAGRALTASGVTVTIDGTPEIAPAAVDGDRYAMPVNVFFYSNIGG
ncbi:phage tail terminator-like protein [Sphingobium bisphenolivorans]|uniref:phage tail terminator-like protein n=1 Tax=Sphingobium bisphenolivorans TaxID=1335760 RepID=UPI0003A7F317|nr:phage tail terminator-like protein [Sphingobium bisphenolivorans]